MSVGLPRTWIGDSFDRSPMFRSILVRLQLSFGFLLLVALAVVGAVSYNLQRSNVYSEIDEGLLNRTKRIVAVLARIESREQQPSDEEMPARLRVLDDEESDRFYIVYDEDDRAVFRSPHAPEDMAAPMAWESIPRLGATRAAGDYRERISRHRRDQRILVGRDISQHRAGLRLFLLRLCLVGLSVFVLLMVGCYVLSRRALRPIGEISRAATHISQGDLEERIDTAGSGLELAQLGDVLNETFDKLADAYQRQRQFTSDAAHELRTPISVILSEVQCGADTLDEYEQGYAVCEKNARAMKELVNRLLELAKFDGGTASLTKEETDVSEMVGDCVEQLRSAAEDKAVAIDTDIEAAVVAHVDVVLMRQVIQNLVSNAISYTEGGGRIDVTVKKANGSALISVRDTGIGIAAEDLPHIFKRFYRADRSRVERENKHYGLGLAITHEIAMAHGADLSVKSELAEGTEFVLEIPLG